MYSALKDIRIIGMAAAVSNTWDSVRELSNEGEQIINKFIKTTGVEGRYSAAPRQCTSDFYFSAAEKILNEKGIDRSEIGVLVFVAQTSDYGIPATACVLQHRLGLNKSCIAFDVNLGCSGFVYGVSIAAGLLKNSDEKKALVLVGDTLARTRKGYGIGQRSSNTTLLFGDASSAILLDKEKNCSIKSAMMSDGTGHKALSAPYNAWKHPVGPESIPGDDIAVFNFTINEVPALVHEYIEKLGVEMESYDDLVLHQANMMIIKNIAKRVGMPMEKIPISLDRFGNTSGASVPLTIVDKYGASNDSKEVKMLTSGFGVGLSWGVMEVKMNTDDILPLTFGKDRYDDDYPDNV